MAAGLILPVNRECLPEAVPADFEGILLCAATCPSIGNVFQKQFLQKLYFLGGHGLDSTDRTRSGFGAGNSPATRAAPPELSEPTPELPEPTPELSEPPPELPEPPCNSYLTSRL